MFLNAVTLVETDLEPLELLRVLQQIEAQFGRDGRFVGARGRWISICLLFEDRILDTPELCLPHPRMRVRRFVLEPLVEVAPAAVDPVTLGRLPQILADLIGSPADRIDRSEPLSPGKRPSIMR